MRKFLILLLLLPSVLFAQEETSNILKYTPAILLEKGKWETVSFYNLYTQNTGRNENGDSFDFNERQTFLNAMYQFTIGTSENGRFNIGFDITATQALYDGDRRGNPFKVLLFEDGEFSRTVLSGIGPRVRVVPLASLPNFSIQSTFLFPVASEMETPRFTAHDRYTSFTQFFYDHELSRKWRLFMELDILYRIKRYSNQVNFLRLPVSAFLSYFPNSKISIYGFSQYSPRYETVSNEIDEQYGLSEYFLQLGIGAKYQWTKRLGIEVSYGDFILSRGVNGAGAGYALNLGFRYIR